VDGAVDNGNSAMLFARHVTGVSLPVDATITVKVGEDRA
jgi:hypothetical protein